MAREKDLLYESFKAKHKFVYVLVTYSKMNTNSVGRIKLLSISDLRFGCKKLKCSNCQHQVFISCNLYFKRKLFELITELKEHIDKWNNSCI